VYLPKAEIPKEHLCAIDNEHRFMLSREGAIVHAGDLLFKIDPRPFHADLDNKKAAVAQAKAMADETKADYQRATMLLKA
jgi:multidrug resistance efflux pump